MAEEIWYWKYKLTARQPVNAKSSRREVEGVLLRIDEGLLRRMLRLATLRATSARGKQETGETEKGTDVLLPVVPRPPPAPRPRLCAEGVPGGHAPPSAEELHQPVRGE